MEQAMGPIMKPELTNEALKGTPAVAGTVAAALTLNEWVAILTGIYVLVQLAYLLRKWWREEKKESSDE
jgi:hypothetical protein